MLSVVFRFYVLPRLSSYFSSFGFSLYKRISLSVKLFCKFQKFGFIWNFVRQVPFLACLLIAWLVGAIGEGPKVEDKGLKFGWNEKGTEGAAEALRVLNRPQGGLKEGKKWDVVTAHVTLLLLLRVIAKSIISSEPSFT